VNLVVNARDAMPNGGSVTVSTRTVVIEDDKPLSSPEARPGKFVSLEIADTGSGMDATTIDRIFEPFFTTKDPGKGTGLGLATVYGIVQQHRGWVTVESELGKGTVFQVLLPVEKSSTVERSMEWLLEPVAGGTGTVLLVEDELALRNSTASVLRRVGYEVIEAGDGQQALDLWKKHSADIDIVCTDMVLPHGISGLDLSNRVSIDRPGTKVVITSGYSAELTGDSAHLPAGTMFLQKPYKPHELASTIRLCLARG
jgi:two-component system, cell cycle sensor histidine kinase and response regulator CckA